MGKTDVATVLGTDVGSRPGTLVGEAIVVAGPLTGVGVSEGVGRSTVSSGGNPGGGAMGTLGDVAVSNTLGDVAGEATSCRMEVIFSNAST